MPVEAQVSNSTTEIQLIDRGSHPQSLWVLMARLQQLFCKLLIAWIRAQQERVLEARLGAKWQPLPESLRQMSCPDCGSVAIRRKCWRERSVTTRRWGTLSIPRRQLTCSDCGHTWMPFDEELKLPRGRFSPAVLHQAISHATWVSYQKAAEACEAAISAATVRRRLLETAPTPSQQQAHTGESDATKVPAWRQADTQLEVSVVHAIGPFPSDRSRRLRWLLGTTAGSETDVKPLLAERSIQTLIHDGSLALEGYADHVVRCRWHVPYTVGFLLYQDQITGDENKARVRKLRQITGNKNLSPAVLLNKLNGWLAANVDAPMAQAHVRGARLGLFLLATPYVNSWSETTSHVEREMREINKRFENGGGWTARGAGAMLAHHQLRRCEPKNWNQQLHEKLKSTLLLD